MRNVMTHIVIALLCVIFLASCATTNTPLPVTQTPAQRQEAEQALQRAKLAREQQHREQMGYESATVTNPGVSGWGVLAGLALLPIAIPLAIMVEYGRSPYSLYVYCRSYTYKDQYHTSCY